MWVGWIIPGSTSFWSPGWQGLLVAGAAEDSSEAVGVGEKEEEEVDVARDSVNVVVGLKVSVDVDGIWTVDVNGVWAVDGGTVTKTVIVRVPPGVGVMEGVMVDMAAVEPLTPREVEQH